MKNFIKNIKSKAERTYMNVKETLSNRRAEGYVDTAVKIVISVVIGTLLLGGLYTLFDTTVIPNLSSKITSIFSYHGN